MPTTFADVYRAVLLRTGSGVDPLLVRDWVQNRYQQACDDKTWSHQRAETAIICAVAKFGTATAILGSATLVVGAGTLVLAATDVGRQLRLNSVPIYTILSVNVAAQTAVLDKTYSEVTPALSTFTILDAYWTAPEDFWRFLAVTDPINKWRLRWWVTEDTLNRIDPGRMSTGSPWALVSQKYSPVAGSLGRARFEVYPYVITARSFYVLYYTKPVVLAETTELIGPFASGGKDLLIEGALADAALYPGTNDKKNPFFNLGLSERYEVRFQSRLARLENKDEDMYPVNMPRSDYEIAPVPWDSNYLQNHVPDTIETAY